MKTPGWERWLIVVECKETRNVLTTSASNIGQLSMNDELIAEENYMYSDRVADRVESRNELLTQLDGIRNNTDLRMKRRTQSGEESLE